MTRSDYLANSARLLMISSGFLFVVNFLSLLGTYVDSVKGFSSTITNVCFYVVLVLGFLAFNGEGIAYKHSRQRKNKKKTVILKIILLSAFFVRFVKTPVKNFGLGIDADSLGGMFSRLGLGALDMVPSYGFLIMIVALWYIFRDKGNKKLFVIQSAVFVSGLIYNLYRLFYYSVSKYDFTYLGEGFSSFFGNSTVLSILCLVFFALAVVMFGLVFKLYDEKAVDEEKEKTAITKKMVTSRKIYSTDCFGLDTMEDDFLLESSTESFEN